MANEMNLPEDPEIKVPGKKTKKHRRFPLQVSLFIAIVLPVILVPSILFGAKWMKNRIVSEIDEKLAIRKTKCIVLSSWKNLMYDAQQEAMEFGAPDSEEEEQKQEELLEYFSYPDVLSDYERGSSAELQDTPHYSLDELHALGTNGINRIAGGIIIDPEGDRFFMMGDSPIVEYGGLSYKLVSVYDEEKEVFEDISVGLNEESEANAFLIEESTAIAARVQKRLNEDPWGAYSESGWCGDYRYTAFYVLDKYARYSPLMFEYDDVYDYITYPASGTMVVETDENQSYVIRNPDQEVEGSFLNINAGDVLTISDSGFMLRTSIRTPMVIFVDAAPQLKTLKNQVTRVSLFAVFAYVLIVAGSVAIELHKSKAPEVEASDEAAGKAEEDRIPDQVANVLLSKITDVEQSMGPNGYLDQLREEIDSRRASREEPEEDA